MSVPVPLERLREAVAERGPRAFVLTVSDDGRPHAVDARLRWDGDALAADVGRRTAGNASARPAVSLLFPARSDGDYSLIVDGTAAVTPGPTDPVLLVTPTFAVLHRRAPGPRQPAASGCTEDCEPVLDRARS
jgi:hypothetical protein